MTKARNIADIGSNDVLDTDANGVDVTGSITAETAVLSGTAPVLNYTDTDNSITAQIGSGTSDFNIATTTSHNIDIRTNNTRRMIVSANGDITMYKSDGSSVGAQFKSSSGFFGLGVSSPAQLLHVNQTTASSDSIVRITNTNTPSTGAHRVEFADGIGTTEGSNVFRYGYIAGERSGGSNDGHIIIGTKPDNSTSPNEKVRITSSGNVSISGSPNTFDTTPSVNGLQLYYESDSGVATIASYSNGGGTQLDFQTNTGAGATDRIMTINTAGVVVNPDAEDKDFRVASDNNSNMLFVDGGSNYVSLGTNATDIGSSSSGEGVTYRSGESLRVQRASGDPLIVNRVTDDGSIIAVRKNGAGIGYIGSDSGKMTVNSSGSNLVFQTGGTSRINIDSTQMYPQTNGAMSLGHPSIRWNHLRLNGEIFFDTTTTGLDDYEQGTFNFSERNGQATVTTNRSHYTKIGNIIFVSASVNVGSNTNGNHLNFNLPFSSTINGYYLGGGAVSYHNLPSAYRDNLRPNIENAGDNVFFHYNGTDILTCAQASGYRIDFQVMYHTNT